MKNSSSVVISRISWPGDPSPVLIKGSKALWAAFRKISGGNPERELVTILAICENNTAWETVFDALPEYLPNHVDNLVWKPSCFSLLEIKRMKLEFQAMDAASEGF